jgi:putative SOS response-associated peptidase YedK
VKQPFLLKRHDGKPFAFAGMWDKVQVKGEFVDAATIPRRHRAASLRKCTIGCQ